MARRLFIVQVLLLAVVALQAQAPTRLAIRAGRLIDGKSDRPIANALIVVEKDRIVSPKRHARALAADLPAAELVIAPDTGHMPHRLRTDLVLAAIRRVNEMTRAPAED